MPLDKEYLINNFGENADFLDEILDKPSEYKFLNKYIKNLKKQISLSIELDKVLEGNISVEDFENSLKSDLSLKAKYNGYFIKGIVTDSDFYQLLHFLNCNNVPKLDTTNNSLLFYNDEYRLFINNIQSDMKNIALLFNNDNKEQINLLLRVYFTDIQQIDEMNDDDVLKLSYDISDLPYKDDYVDYNTGVNLIEIQDALYSTYSYSTIDYLLTLGLIYRLKQLNWDKDYIDFISKKGRGFNILNSKTHIILDNSIINSLLDMNYIDSDYSLTESGRSALLLMNYITPINANNYGNYFVSISNIVSKQNISKDNLLYISTGKSSLFGIRDEFFVDEKSLMGQSKGLFTNDSGYSLSVGNSLTKLNKAKVVGYTSNVTISNTQSLEFEICQNLFNTFNDDFYNVSGGLVGIMMYDSKEIIYINSLIYRLIKRNHNNITPYISETNKSYVVFKDFSDNIVAIIKSKDFTCQKDFIGTKDISLLYNKINKTYSLQFAQGLDLSSNSPSIVGEGFIEKSELSADDFNKLITVGFKELKSTLRLLNKDEYYNELDENDIIAKIIAKRKDEYDVYLTGIKDEMGKKLMALEIISEYYNKIGNEDKKTYYYQLIEDYKEKINNFRM